MSPASSSSRHTAVGTTADCDVLIVGAGPAGSAAARAMSTAGHHVAIVDQRSFPRDKVCGDALISDALSELAALGVQAAVRREAWSGHELRLYAPNGRHVALHGSFACLPRERFDALLLEAACDAGAQCLTGAAIAPLLDGDRVTGARFRGADGTFDVRARFTVLATGSNVTVLEAFGLRGAKKPDSVAGRAYYQASPEVAAQVNHLSIVYDRRWCPGYGWIFPGPDGRFNIGVGMFGNRAAHGRLHEFFEAFIGTFPLAAPLIRSSTLIGEFRGSPIRSGLRQTPLGRRGLLVAGEAGATTYSATGEGIGKAMQSAVLAAALVDETLRGARDEEGLERTYEQELRRRYHDWYRAYRVAQRWAASPVLLNFLERRANRGRFVQSALESLLAERGNATALFSAAGLLQSLFR